MSSACSNRAEESGVPGGSGGMAPGTGGVAFRLVWQQPLTRAKALLTPSFNACVDRGIATIAATVSDGTTTVSASWPCSAHEGLILGVPAGTSYTVQINGISSGATIWSGLTSTIIVNASQITDAGTIVMGYVGGDTTRPTVLSIDPHSNPTTTANVPATDRFSIVFDEPMAISTIKAANITLKLIDNTPVSGIVSYNRANNTAAIVPSTPLAYNTQYVLQVVSCITATSCITDLAGNSLVSDYTNTLMTESAPVGVPAAPSGVTASPGNGQVTLDWLASNGSASYTVYYLNSAGVTTLTGTKIPDARAPFVHIGLTNNQTYYYLVTAVNGTGETQAAAEVNATPVFPAGNPLPPASVTVISGSSQNSISWPAVTGATSYNLYWSTMPITPDITAADNVIRDVTSPFTHTGLTNGLPYCYIITAMNANGESAGSMQACGGLGAIQLLW
jgi:hypothetical protein